ncbi:MAG: extensin-like protein [Myxococcaceae bacterium]
MKKAFDANVSRARPRLRLNALPGEPAPELVEQLAQKVAAEAVTVHTKPTPSVPAPPVIPDLKDAVRARAEASSKPKPTMLDALQMALEQHPVAPAAAVVEEPAFETPVFEAPVAKAQVVAPVAAPQIAHPQAQFNRKLRAGIEPPAQVVEVRQPVEAPAVAAPANDPAERREKLKERLKAVRENPKPEPLPETVAEAGVLAVERISGLQTELMKVRTVNLALSQDLEAARRQAERATEEARLRMDEARRLSTEMEQRAKLLSDLERELASLEGERNDSLVALQEARQALDLGETEKQTLRGDISQRDKALEESLAEEERLAAELESAHETAAALRRSTDALRIERDTFARQVADLTKERAELMEARKALEAVHRALSKASARS